MTFRDNLFAGKVALVVGGTGGIGAAIADIFATLGAVVTVTGATDEEVNAVRDGADFRCRDAVALDVRDGESIAALIGDLPRLDILVNCAGVIRRDAEHDADVFAEVVDINLNGTMRLCGAARERLKAARGAIVNTASMLAYHGGARVPAYSASKGGVAQLTKSLAIAYAADGVRVNAVAPGWVRTALTQTLQNDSERSTAILARTPQGRWAEPADIAGAVVFLCSPAARFVTGVVLPVDGGYLAM
ncbi:MAG: SDR family oxidoreductase [Betaproteobacteria bacterium]|nr:MAG: SDR family oxidoreductase [Betaproteobacteria bacterium]